MFRRALSLRCSAAVPSSGVAASAAASAAADAHRPRHINQVHLVGVVHDVVQGYVYEEPVVQFLLAVAYAPIDGDAPSMHPSSSPTATATPVSAREKEMFTVRCIGGLPQELRSAVCEGATASVRGALRMNVQIDSPNAVGGAASPLSSSGEKRPFPYIAVLRDDAQADIEILSPKRAPAASAPERKSSAR